MKTVYRNQLIKDVIIAVAACLIISALFSSSFGSFAGALPIGIFLAGIPFGWKFWSKIFVALSWQVLLLKLLLSIIAGWVALPIVLVKDVLVLATAKD